jgi:hypothetical protein
MHYIHFYSFENCLLAATGRGGFLPAQLSLFLSFATTILFFLISFHSFAALFCLRGAQIAYNVPG